jgi:uncharacterized metal-binding protein
MKAILGSILRFLSIGKYNHGLYYKGRSHHSSILGGILAMLVVIAILTYLVFTLYGIIAN